MLAESMYVALWHALVMHKEQIHSHMPCYCYISQVVRNEIKEFAATRQLFNDGIKLIILDEADVSVVLGIVLRFSTVPADG